MIFVPSLAMAMTAVYTLNRLISAYFSETVTGALDLLLFVAVFVATHAVLRNLRGD